MKKTKFLSLCLLVVTAFNFISCSGDVEPLDPAVELTPPQASSFFKVDFSNQTFQANTTIAYISANNILISGVKSTGQTVNILLDGTTARTYDHLSSILSYTQSPNSDYDYVNINELPDGNYVSNGSVVITAIDTNAKTISGTFSFTGYWSDFTDENPPAPIEFTNGSFTIPYTTSANPPSTGDSFFAKVNGTEFVDDLISTAYASSGESAWITITATNAQSRISVAVDDDAELGTHTITDDFFSNKARGVYQIGEITPSNAVSGSVTIISKSADRIKGTFQFTVGTGQAITEGTFDVEY